MFDLDNTLSSAEEIGPELLSPVFEAIRQANNAHVRREALDRALSQCWHHPFDFVAAQNGFSQAMLMAGWHEFAQIEVQAPMSGYSDLKLLAELPVLRFLVTSGFRRLQRSKISALGIEELFTEVHIDAIDDPERRGKQKIFQSILMSYGLLPDEALVVGDNPDSEIAAGNNLGIRTVQVLRPGVVRGSNATYYIQALYELLILIRDDR